MVMRRDKSITNVAYIDVLSPIKKFILTVNTFELVNM